MWFTGANSLFSAALFFAALLIARPETPSKEVFRQHVHLAINCLAQLEHYVPHAGNGRVVLQALAPLFNDDLDDAARAQQIEALISLTFPSHDGPLSPLRRRLAVRPDDLPVAPHYTRARGRVDRKVDYTTSDGQLPGEIILHPTSPTTSKTGRKTRSTFDDDNEDGDSEYAGSDTEEEETKNVLQSLTRPEPQMPVLASSDPSATTTPISAMTTQELSHISPAPAARPRSSMTSSTPSRLEHQGRQSHQLSLQVGGLDGPLPPGYPPAPADGVQANGAAPQGCVVIRSHTATPPPMTGDQRSPITPSQAPADANQVMQGYRAVPQRFLNHTQHPGTQFQISMQRATSSEYDDQIQLYGAPQMSPQSATFAYPSENMYRTSPTPGFDHPMQPPIISPHPYVHPHASYSRTQYGAPPDAPQQEQSPTLTALAYQNQPQVAMSGYPLPAGQMHVGYRDSSRTANYPSRQQPTDVPRYDEHATQHPNQPPRPNQLPEQESNPWARPPEFWA